MFFDGISLIDKEIHTPNESTAFVLKPTWRLGYCKESLLAPNVEITRGRIRDFSAWSRALTDNEMLTFTRDCSTDKENPQLKPDLIEWKTMQVNQTGLNVAEEVISFKHKETILFKANCKTLDFKQQEDKVLDRFIVFVHICFALQVLNDFMIRIDFQMFLCSHVSHG